MPNVGKSTLYNALSNCSIPAENFPFCTIDPNSTRVHVPDDRFDWLVDHHKPKSAVQPFLEIVDIAGLVKGASGGAGLGNAFLSHIKAGRGVAPPGGGRERSSVFCHLMMDDGVRLNLHAWGHLEHPKLSVVGSLSFLFKPHDCCCLRKGRLTYERKVSSCGWISLSHQPYSGHASEPLPPPK